MLGVERKEGQVKLNSKLPSHVKFVDWTFNNEQNTPVGTSFKTFILILCEIISEFREFLLAWRAAHKYNHMHLL